MMMGVMDMARMSAHTWVPVRPGIMMSSITRSGRIRWNASITSSPRNTEYTS